MKKSILIGVLAVLMLFAFTACEQKMPSYQAIEYVTVAQNNGAYINGQPLSASDFTVTVHYLDGSYQDYEGSGRIEFSKETAGKDVTATGTVAGKSDTIDVKYVEPAAFTATVSADAVTRNYVKGSGETATAEAKTVDVKVSNLVITNGDSSWAVADTDAGSMLSGKTVQITSEDQVNVGSIEKEVTLSLQSAKSVEFTTKVAIEIKANTTNPNDPAYVAGAVAIEKNDVKKIGVIFAADVKSSDFAGETPKYEISDILTGTAEHTVAVGDTVKFTLIGLDGTDMTNKLPYILQSGDSQEVGKTTIPTGATTADNITGRIVDEKEVAKLTGTYQFKPGNTGSEGNFGDNLKITLNVTVTDKLNDPSTTISATEFVYGGKWKDETTKDAWIGSDVVEGQALNLSAGDFSVMVKTVGEDPVKIVADKIWGPDNDKLNYAVGELKAGQTIELTVAWSYNDEVLGGPYKGVGKAKITVQAAADKT